MKKIYKNYLLLICLSIITLNGNAQHFNFEEILVEGQTSTKKLTTVNISASNLDNEFAIVYGINNDHTPIIQSAVLSNNHKLGLSCLAVPNSIGNSQIPTTTDDEVILNYDGDNNSAIGWALPTNAEVAAKFTASMTATYAGMQLTSVFVFINDLGENFKLKVYGMGTNIAPGSLLVEQDFYPNASSWHLIELDEPITIIGEDLWVGYSYIQQMPDIFVSGCDAGPNDPNGDWFKTDGGWEHISSYDLPYNWNIRACLNEEEVVANFTSNATNVTAGDQVHFIDQSTGNITSRNWTFYGGTPSSSTQQNPTITYNTPGNYTVSLTVTGPGGSDTETKINYITVVDEIVANFTSNATNVTAGDQVHFIDQSTGNITSRNWTFYGGTPSSSTQQNPTITYNSPGNYTVSLTVTGPGGSDTETKINYITVINIVPDPHFEFEGGDPSSDVWTIYLGGGTFEGVDLVYGDEIAIFDGEVMVGAFMLEQILTMDNALENDLVAFSVLFTQPGYQTGNVYFFKCWDASQEIESEYFDIELFNPYGDAYTGDVFPSGGFDYSIVDLDFSPTPDPHFEFEGGDPSSDVWTIYLGGGTIEGVDLVYGDEIAIFDGEVMVGTFMLDQILTMDNAFENDLVAFSVLFTQPGYQPGNIYSFKCWDASQEIESEYFDIELFNPYGDAYTGDVFPSGGFDYSIVDLDFSPTPDPHFEFEGGDPGNAIWTIYLGGGTIEGVDLVPGDEIAIFDGEVMVGTYMLDQILTMDNAFENDLVAFSVLLTQPGYQPGNVYSFKCWDASEELEIEYFEIELFNPYGDAYIGDVFPSGDSDYSIIALDFLSVVSQSFDLSFGFQFISSAVNPTDPNMLIVIADVLNDNLDFVRNSQGQTLRKIGPNWINGIGDWIVDEGYLVKMFADDTFTIMGAPVNPSNPIPVEFGFQFVSYFPAAPMDALVAFATIIGDDLDFIRNSQGQTLRKIGPIWVNGIGDATPSEGYLVKMFAGSEIIYPASAKSSSITTTIPTYFTFEGGNPADPVFTIYVEDLEICDEVAAFDGEKMIGSVKINSQNPYENELPVFNTLINGVGYEEGNPIILKVWNKSENKEYVLNNYTFLNPYGDAWTEDVFPAEDGEYSLLHFSATGVSDENEMDQYISIYPNPTTGIITIGNLRGLSLEITDLRGRTFFQSKIVNQNSNMEIDLSDLRSGVYFIRIKGKNFNKVEKIVIQ